MNTGEPSVRALQAESWGVQVRTPVSQLLEEALALEQSSYADMDALKGMLAEWHQGHADLIEACLQQQWRILNLLEKACGDG